MADLITPADLTDRATLNAAQLARAAALIADASALARLEAKNDFDLVTDDTIVLRTNAGKLVLPNPPIVSIGSVVGLGDTNFQLPAGTWQFDGIDTIHLLGHSWVINLPEEWAGDWAGQTYRVTYTHGYDVVPPEIVATIARMVLRCLASPSQAEGVTGEQIGQYSYQMSQAMGSSGSGVFVSAADRAIFRHPKFRRSTRTVETPIGGGR